MLCHVLPPGTSLTPTWTVSPYPCCVALRQLKDVLPGLSRSLGSRHFGLTLQRRRIPLHAAQPQRRINLCCRAEVGNNASFDKELRGGENDAARSFCIIEGRDTVQDFARMQLQEIKDNIAGRRNRIFLLMEEVRRLRIQQRIKQAEQNVADNTEHEEEEMPEYPSSIPFLPPLTTDTLDQYYATFFALIASIIVFGGFFAPLLELRLGMGGTSYEDFIRSMHLPLQLSQVDPIVASFSGGAVGVISALMVVEINNVKRQEHKRCKYCHGTGYLACARCSGRGSLIAMASAAASASPASAGNGSTISANDRCPNCSGAGKVMCPTCLCTGMALATEHDPRIDPFD